MEFEGFKSAWQKQSRGGQSALTSQATISRSLLFLRTTSIRDVQRSEELSRFVFSLLFALVAVGGSIAMMAPGAGRYAAWLFALSLLVDGAAGMALLTRRLRQSVAETTLDFIKREHHQAQARLKFERYSQRLVILLGVVALLLMIVSPTPDLGRQNIFEPFCRIAVVTAFLALAWRRAKSRSKEAGRELDGFLRDLER